MSIKITGLSSDCRTSPIIEYRFSRRDVLRTAAAGTAGIVLSDLTAPFVGANTESKVIHPYSVQLEGLQKGIAITKKPNVKEPRGLIVVFCEGGISQLESFDPKPKASSNIKGYFDALQSKNGVYISDRFPHTTEVIDKALIVRSVHSKTSSKLHHTARYNLFTGSPEMNRAKNDGPMYQSFHNVLANGTLHQNGQIGIPVFNTSYISSPETELLGPRILYSGMSSAPNGFQHPFGDSISLDGLSEKFKIKDKLDKYSDLQENKTTREFQELQESAREAVLKRAWAEAYDLTKVEDSLRDEFGETPFGNSALTALRLIRAGAWCVGIQNGGWDMHYDLKDHMNDGDHIPPFDQGFAALINHSDETDVILVSEFGRTPQLDEGNSLQAPGRNHFNHSFSMVFAGKSYPPGVIGKTNLVGDIIGNDDAYDASRAIVSALDRAGYQTWIIGEKKPVDVWPMKAF